MIREAAQNTIVHLKDIPNEKNKIFERHKRKLIETQQNMGQDEQKMVSKITRMKAAIPFKNLETAKQVEHHIELKMELVCKVDKAGALIKDK